MLSLTKKVFSSQYFFGLVLCYQFILFIIICQDPFFGDAISSTAQATHHIYNSNLLTIFYPAIKDPGHPTLYPWLLAACWKIFGKQLWVAHAYGCLWSLVFAYAFKKLASVFLSIPASNMALVALLCFSTYLSQSVMMLNTMALMSFFMLAVRGVYTGNKWAIVTFSTLMCITHLQSLFLLLSLACLHLVYRNEKNLRTWFIKHFWVYATPFLTFVGWLIIHHQHAGWWLVSPDYSDVNELNGFTTYIKALLIAAWRLIDYGMVGIYLLLIGFYIKQKEARPILNQWFFLALPCLLTITIFLNNTIGHRYFLVFNAFAIILLFHVTLLFTARKQQVLITITTVVSLIAGNLLYYPGKNLGDATIAYRGYFKAIAQLREEVGPDFKLYSHAPVANPTFLTNLISIQPEIYRINDTPLDSLPAIIQSNVNAEFSVTQQRYLTQNWYGKTYSNGVVYVNLFLNPKFHSKPKNWHLREPSTVEKLMLKLKARAGK